MLKSEKSSPNIALSKHNRIINAARRYYPSCGESKWLVKDNEREAFSEEPQNNLRTNQS